MTRRGAEMEAKGRAEGKATKKKTFLSDESETSATFFSSTKASRKRRRREKFLGGSFCILITVIYIPGCEVFLWKSFRLLCLLHFSLPPKMNNSVKETFLGFSSLYRLYRILIFRTTKEQAEHVCVLSQNSPPRFAFSAPISPLNGRFSLIANRRALPSWLMSTSGAVSHQPDWREFISSFLLSHK